MQGILFKPWKIKAVAANPDKEWQTRRVLKLQPPEHIFIGDIILDGFPIWVFANEDGEQLEGRCPQPRYQVGETVYIKEAWHLVTMQYPEWAEVIVGGELRKVLWNEWLTKHRYDKDWYKSRSPRFLLEEFARYFIKIMDVRPERLNDITEEDAIAEGIERSERTGRYLPGNCDYARWAYEILWDSINPKYPWVSNPFVFRYEFIKMDRL